MTTITVMPNQSMLDVILQGTGSMEAGMQFCKDNGVGITDAPVVGATYVVSDNVMSFADTDIVSSVASEKIKFGTLGATPPSTPLVLWVSPIRVGSAPSYAIPYFRMTFGAGFADIPTMVFYNTADEVTEMIYLNSTVVPTYGMTGAFVLLGNDIVYNQGVGENWICSVPPIVLPELMVLTIQPTSTSGSPNDYQYSFDGIGSYHVVDWGDGSAPVSYHPTVITVQTAAHTYLDALSGKTINMFHNNTLLQVLAFDYTGSLYTLKIITGRIPISLIGLNIGGQQMATTASIPIAGINLSNFLVVGSTPITAFSPSLFAGAFNNLPDIVVAYNQLTSSEVDRLFNDFVANSPLATTHGGSFVTFNQTPPAPPTAASAAARAALIAAGWTIVTD